MGMYSGGEVLVDACALENHISLIDDSGQPVQLPSQPEISTEVQPRVRWRDTFTKENIKTHIVGVALNLSLRPMLTRCSNCRKRAKARRAERKDRRERAAVATEADGINLRVLADSALGVGVGVENADTGLRTPLRDSLV